MVSAVALLNAGFLLVARLCRLGFLADFLSRTVLVGFLAGVGVQVGLGMLYDMLGLVSDRHTPVLQALELERGIPRANGVAALISCIACLILLLGQKYMPRKPVALAVIGLGMLLGWSGLPAAHGVRLLGAVQGGVPVLHVPVVPWENILALLPFRRPACLSSLPRARRRPAPLPTCFMKPWMRTAIFWGCQRLMPSRG
jgi:MFS superfamily sulfate permease-like transporter